MRRLLIALLFPAAVAQAAPPKAEAFAPRLNWPAFVCCVSKQPLCCSVVWSRSNVSAP